MELTSRWMWFSIIIVITCVAVGMANCFLRKPTFAKNSTLETETIQFYPQHTSIETTTQRKTLDMPIRSEPSRFLPGTHLPPIRELFVCGGIDLVNFSPSNELIRIDDDRVWWQSDNDVGATEDDHIIHISVETPLRRLIELVHKCGGKLKVHDAYSLKSIHAPLSLHKEGRAIDVTCEGLSLEKLAKLCWVAGFDWVFYEQGTGKSGAHIHCSVAKKKGF